MLSTLPILIVCSDSKQVDKTAELACNIGLQSIACSSLTDARTLVEQHTFQLILCADDLPDCNLGTSLKVLASATGGVPVVVLSHLAEWEAYVRALSAGAFDYIACPPDRAETERILRLALRQDRKVRSASQNGA